jgi:hypothetical protein
VKVWNSHDLEKVLSHFADDVVLTSPGRRRTSASAGSNQNITGDQSDVEPDPTRIRGESTRRRGRHGGSGCLRCARCVRQLRESGRCACIGSFADAVSPADAVSSTDTGSSTGNSAAPCHGSKYAIADCSVVPGPASRALAQRQITVLGDAVLLE